LQPPPGYYNYGMQPQPHLRVQPQQSYYPQMQQHSPMAQSPQLQQQSPQQMQQQQQQHMDPAQPRQ
jgi:hypothetical protein